MALLRSPCTTVKPFRCSASPRLPNLPTTSCRASLLARIRTPRMKSQPVSLSSNFFRVSLLIKPRSATTHTRPIPKRSRTFSNTGRRPLTSAALPGHISQHRGSPCPSNTTPTTICAKSGRLSLEWPRCPRVCPPAPSKYKLVVSKKTIERLLNKSCRSTQSDFSILSLSPCHR